MIGLRRTSSDVRSGDLPMMILANVSDVIGESPICYDRIATPICEPP
jgi:hypothetical protein